MKHIISLYRVVRTEASVRSETALGSFEIAEGYRIFTEQDVHIPFGYMLMGVATHKNYDNWFEQTIIPIIEQHNGDKMFDTWAYSQLEDPEHVTIAMCIDDVLVAPDLLNNMTSFFDGPKDHLVILRSIGQSVRKFTNRKIRIPPICASWWLKKEIECITTKNVRLQMCT